MTENRAETPLFRYSVTETPKGRKLSIYDKEMRQFVLDLVTDAEDEARRAAHSFAETHGDDVPLKWQTVGS